MGVIGMRCRRSSLGLALTALTIVLIGTPAVLGQQFEIGQNDDRDDFGIGAGPGNVTFCVGDPCPGQTCDETNDRCVGTTTLQPCLGEPITGLSADELDRFELGKILFNTDIGEATGLGPVFNQTSCGACHSNPLGGSGTITVTRFGTLDFGDFSFDPLASLGGSLLNAESISPECAEEIPLPETNIASLRLTNSALGFGLVQAIPDADIDFNELNPPGVNVSGRALTVPVLENPPQTATGRFGWKAQLATVLSFSADASLQEMGFSNRIFPMDNAPNADDALLAACDTVPDPEDGPDSEGQHFIDRVTDFQRFLAPPPQTPKSGMMGEGLFNVVGCADCHVATFMTPNDAGLEPALRNKEVHAYSDFLVHDMGFSADFIEQGDAGVFELRTPPLWGMRIRDPLWHDGRVAGGTFDFRIRAPGGIIDQHNSAGSESEASAQAFLALSDADQLQVVAFLESLGRCEFDGNGDNIVNDLDIPSFDACLAGFGPYVADHECAVHDVNQDGQVDQEDLDLFEVALGVVQPDDEDEDEDGDDPGDPGDELDDDNQGADGDATVTFDPGSNDDGGDGGVAPDGTQNDEEPKARERRTRSGNRRHRGL